MLKHFGHSVRALALSTVDEVFQEVESGAADFGVVAIENSSEGTITNTLDRFLASGLHICGEVELRIHHCLMGKMDSLERVLRVCSHSQALAQCRGWLNEHLPDAERVPVASNAEGARRARDEQGTAAIAGETAAEVYDLNLLAREIEDRSDNTTRFIVIGRKLLRPSGADRTTLLLSARRHTVPRRAAAAAGADGALRHQHEPHRIAAVAPAKVGLRVLHRHRGTCRGARGAQGTQRAQARASLFRVLGSYPRAVI